MAERKTLRVQLPGDMADGKAGREGETPSLVPVLAVGMTCVPGGVCLMSKDTVAYPVGRCLAMYSPTQLPLVRMSEPLRQVRGITALAVSPNKKYLAAAENMADGYMPQITLFDGSTLERLATVTGPHVTASYTCVSFSSNGSLLLAVGADEARGTSTFHLWEWGASPQPRCSGTINTGGEEAGGGGGGSGGPPGPVLRAALDPRFDSNVLVLCARDVGLWRQSPNGFRRHAVEGVDLPPGASFLDLSTLPDGRFLLATSTRQVLVVDRANAHVALTTDRPIMTVLGLPDGCIAVGTERGYLQLFRRRAKDDHDHYAIYSETRVPESAQSVSLDAHIRAMCSDTAGDTLLCTTAGGGPTYQFNLAYARTLALTPEASSDLWEMLLPGAHEQSIVSASLAYKRDFLATASKDLTVRVWQTSPLRLVLTHMCHHSPLALSIDPYGRELVVAFVDCVRCYSVVEGLLVDGEELRHEFGPANPGAAGATTTTAPQPTAASLAAAAAGAAGERGRRGGGGGGGGLVPGEPAGVPLDHCSLVKYSPTGAFIAAAGGPGGRHIYIFSTLTKRQVAVLTGHYEAVMDLVWSDDGAYLASTGEGAVFTWAVDGWVRVQENTSKLYLNDAIACTPDFKTLVVGDTTQGLRIMETLRNSAANNSADGGDGAGGGAAGGGGKLANAFSKALGGKSGRSFSVAAGGGGGGGGGGAESGAVTENGGASGSVPDTPVFKVPGKASLVPIGPNLDTQHTGSFVSQNRSKMQAVSRMTAMVGGGPPESVAASAAAASMAGCELKLRSNFQTIIQPGRGGLAIAHCAPTLMPGGHGTATVYGGYDAVVGAGVLGRVRVCPLRPKSNDDVQEYFLHASDVTQVVAHRDGRLVITTDASGTWMLNILLPPGLTSAAAAASASAHAIMPASPGAGGADAPSSPTRSSSPTRALSTAGSVMLQGRVSMAGGLAALVAAGGALTHADRTALAHKLIRTVLAASEFSSYAATSAARAAAAAHSSAAAAESGAASAQLIVSVRAVDVQLLKENVRELKDRLAKFATEAEYKMYEREQVVRRELEGEVGRLRQEVDVLRADLAYTRATAADDANNSERTRENMTRDFERALQEQQDMFEKKLAAEISRTDAAEREMQRLRAKFGRKLWQLDEEHGAAMREAGETQAVLANTIEATKAEAQKNIAASRAQMETELRVDGELNEEELQRAADAAQKQIEEKDEAYLKLLAKHTLQSGLSAKTAQENERLRAEAEALRKENTRLAEQVMALTEELEAMQAAWADRDARQRQQDAEMKDMAFQMQQAQLFTSLATTRIKELNNELEPVRGARDEAQAQVATMEGVAQRQLERQAKVVSDNSNLQSRLDAANDELKQVKGTLLEREAYFKNFTTQLFRTVQDVPHHQWPTLFGRMIEDYHKGRDKASWSRYLEADHGNAAHPPGSAGAAIASGATTGRNTSASGLLGSSATTAAEFNEKINELHAQLMHTEKMLSLVTETKDKADKARRAVVSKLMADNLMVVQELNDTKRDLKLARELAEKRAIELADLRMSVAVAGGVAGTGLTGAGPSAISGAPSAADVGAGAAGGVGLPQGPAGRAMSRLPSRLGDPSRQQASSNGQGPLPLPPPSVSPRASDSIAAGGSSPGPSVSGNGGGPGGSSLLGHSGRSPSIPEHASVSQPVPSSAGGAQPMVVTGDMPQGGWWLGECSPFELPASMDHIASSSLRRSGLSSAATGTSAGEAGLLQERPGTSVLMMSSRRPGTSAGVSGGGRPGSYSVSMPPGSARTAFTPPTPHGSLPGPRRPDTSGSSSLMAAAVSGAALQAYNRQQQQQQQQQQQTSQDGPADAGSGGGDGAPAAPPSPSLANGSGSGHGPRASSAGPPSGSITSRSGNSALRSTVAFGAPPSHGPFASVAHSSATAASATGSPVVLSPGGGGGAGYAGTHNMLSGQVRPNTPSKVTTLGAGFRSFVPMGQGQGHGGGGGAGGLRGNSR